MTICQALMDRIKELIQRSSGTQRNVRIRFRSKTTYFYGRTAYDRVNRTPALRFNAELWHYSVYCF